MYYSNELYHHGVKGQKWYLRRYQNEDGSLTDEGYIHYGYGKRGRSAAKAVGVGAAKGAAVGSLTGGLAGATIGTIALAALSGPAAPAGIAAGGAMYIAGMTGIGSLGGGLSGIKLGAALGGIHHEAGHEYINKHFGEGLSDFLKRDNEKTIEIEEKTPVYAQRWNPPKLRNEDGTLTEAGKKYYKK